MGAVPDLDLLKIRKYCEEKTPQEFRSQMRVEVGVRGKSVTIFESRPPWDKQGTEWSRLPIGQPATTPQPPGGPCFGRTAIAAGTLTTSSIPERLRSFSARSTKIPPASSGVSSWGPIESSPATELILKRAD